MGDNGNQGESLTEFIKSFSYGSRCDLNFKFMSGLDEAEAAEFMQALFCMLGEALDQNDLTAVHALVRRYQAQAYTNHGERRWHYDETPFAPLQGALADMRVGLLTTTGHFEDGDDPKPWDRADLTQEEMVEKIGPFMRLAPVLSELPTDINPAALRVRHPGYDVCGAQRDRNVALPLDRLRELEDEGAIGELASPAYSFVGVVAQGILKREIPGWVARIKSAGIKAMILAPV